MQDLTEWLTKVGLEQYADTMLENDIGYDILGEITDQDLKELGLSIGHRRRMLAAIKEIAADHQAAVIPAGATEPEPTGSTNDIAEHRQLTVLFCDLAASTEMSQTLNSEDLREVTLAYQTACKEAIERHEGFVARYMGDGMLAYFGYPKAHEDDAQLGIHAGLAIVEGLKHLNEKLGQSKGVALAVRVGIATGPVIVGDLIGKGPSQESAVVGETPNLAARLQGLAALDCVVISPSTYRLSKDYFNAHSLGPQTVKGFNEPVEAWQVDGVTLADSDLQKHSDNIPTPLMGREEETEILARRWTLSKQGRGQVVFLSGEPGIGKSRLLQYLREQSESDPHTRLRYHCSQHHTNSPLYPFVQQFEYAAGFEHGDNDDQKLDKLVAMSEQTGMRDDTHIALLASLLAISLNERYPAFTGDSRQQRSATHDMLQKQLELLVAKAPVLIAFEDLHWIDPSSLEMLDRIIERIAEMPVLLVLTFRPDFKCPWTGLPHSKLLALNRISKDDTLAIVEKLTKGKGFSNDLIKHIVSRTDGVPLFVEELTKMLIESGQSATPAGAGESDSHNDFNPPPETLRDSLAARLDRLGPTKSVAQICAVIGRQVDYRLLERVASMQSDQLSLALDKLIETGLMSCRGAPPDSVYTFKHALIQDTAYQSMLTEKRVAIHGKIADTIQEHFKLDIERRPEIIANHYLLSEHLSLALDYFEKAAKRMLGRSNYVEGIYYLQQALKIIKSEPDSAERDEREIGVQIAMGGAMIATKGFAAHETGDTYTRAADLYKQIGGDSSRFNPVRYGVWVVHLVRCELQIAHELAEEFVSVAESQSNPTEHLVAYRTMGSCLTFMGEWDEAIEHFDKALSLYDRDLHSTLAVTYAQDPRIAALTLQSWALLHRGRLDDALASADKAVKEAYAFEHLHTTAYTLGLAGALFHQFCGDLKRTREGADALVELCSTQPVPLWSNLGTCLQGWAIGMEGQIDAGIKQLQAGYDGFVSTGARLFIPYFTALKAELHVKGGQFEQAVTALEEAGALHHSNSEGWFAVDFHRINGDLYRKMDLTSRAEAAYHAGLELARNKNDLLNQLRCTMGLAELAQSSVDKQSMRHKLAEIISRFTQGGSMADISRANEVLESL